VNTAITTDPRVLAARGLSDLLTVLRTIEHECTATGTDAVTYYDATELPVFGGDAPEETSWPIRSWDTNNLLVGAGNVIEWKIVPRTGIAKRFSIYAGQPIQALLTHVQSDSRSGRLNTVAERYLVIVRATLAGLQFTAPEWCAIVAANRDVCDPTWSQVWAAVAEAGDRSEQWGVDADALVLRLRRLPVAGQIAVTEVIERFWSQARQPEQTYEQVLAEIGVPLNAETAP
jgi:hypothetical protein